MALHRFMCCLRSLASRVLLLNGPGEICRRLPVQHSACAHVGGAFAIATEEDETEREALIRPPFTLKVSQSVSETRKSGRVRSEN